MAEIVDDRARMALVTLATRLGYNVSDFEDLENQLIYGIRNKRNTKGIPDVEAIAATWNEDLDVR